MKERLKRIVEFAKNNSSIIGFITGLITIGTFFYNLNKTSDWLTASVNPNLELRYLQPPPTNSECDTIAAALVSLKSSCVSDSQVGTAAIRIGNIIVDTFLESHHALFHYPLYVTVENHTTNTISQVKLICPFKDGYYYTCPHKLPLNLEHKSKEYIVKNLKPILDGAVPIKELRPSERVEYAICIDHSPDAFFSNIYDVDNDHNRFSLVYPNGETQEIYNTLYITASSRIAYLFYSKLYNYGWLHDFFWIVFVVGLIYLILLPINFLRKKLKVRAS